MKDKLETIGGELILALLMPLILAFLLLALLWDLIASPFQKASYQKSHFYRDFGEKYSSDVYGSDAYRIYNAVRKANLLLTATPSRGKKGEICDILFTYKDTLLYISPVWLIDYDKEKDKWECEVYNEKTDEDETVDFNEYITKLIEEEIPTLPDLPPTKRTIILLQKNHISQDNLSYAEASGLFLLYDKDNIAEMISKFITES